MSVASHQSPVQFDDAAVYRVGDLMINVGTQRVTRGAEAIRLPKLSFDLLLALVRAAPNLVSLDGLMQEVWPNLVVSPETVSQRVKLLRDALGDDPHAPHYIAGVRGRGYRIIAPVCREARPSSAVGEALGNAADPLRRSSTPARRQWIPAATLSIIVFMVAAVSVVITRMGNSSGGRSAPASDVTVSALPERAIAVLPFTNLSGDTQDEFVALGIAEGVLHRVARIRDLTVISRRSSFSFRDKPADARDIGLVLNARYLVEGSVQRAGDRLRVTAQLIDASSGARVWSLRFDRTLDDIFAMEDEISTRIAQALEVSLVQTAHPFARFGTEAYLTFLQGRDLVASRSVANAERAVQIFMRVIEIAPDFAAAYAALAGAHINLAQLTETYGGSSPDLVPAYDRAQPLIERALQLDASLGDAYVLRADVKAHKGDAAGAEADYRRGLALSPSYGVGYGRLAEFLHEQPGRFEEALAAIDRARQLDPLTPRHHYYKAMMLHFTDKLPEAEALYLETLEVDPNFHPALIRLAQLRRSRQGRFAEAVKLAERAVSIDPRADWARAFLIDFYLELEDVNAARAVVMEQPSMQPLQWLPICLFAGASKRGAILVRTNPGRSSVQVFASYLLRDEALESGRFDDARKEILSLFDRTGEVIHPSLTVTLAQLTTAAGDRREGERLAHEVLAREKEIGGYAFAYPQAVAFSVLGQKDAALQTLRRNFDQGVRQHWWYRLVREPAFEPLRSDPRFKALVVEAQAHAAAQRALLEQMRERGEVPRRMESAASATLC